MSLMTISRCYYVSLLAYGYLMTILDSAADVGLSLFVRFDDDGDGTIHPIDDLPADATVGDLIAAIKRMREVDERMWRMEVRYQDTDLMSGHGMKITLADCGLSMESVVNVLMEPTDTLLMQRFLRGTNAKEKVESVRDYWDDDCCKWNEGPLFHVGCDKESGKVVRVIMSMFISGKFDVKSLPNSVQDLYIGNRGFHFEPIHLQDLSHLSRLKTFFSVDIPIDPASQMRQLPPSLEIMFISDSPTPMRWDFTQLNRYLPNLIELDLIRTNFVGALDFGDRVPQSLERIQLSQSKFDGEGADLNALMADECNLKYFHMDSMKTSGFKQAIGPLLKRLKEVKPEMDIKD